MPLTGSADDFLDLANNADIAKLLQPYGDSEVIFSDVVIRKQKRHPKRDGKEMALMLTEGGVYLLNGFSTDANEDVDEDDVDGLFDNISYVLDLRLPLSEVVAIILGEGPLFILCTTKKDVLLQTKMRDDFVESLVDHWKAWQSQHNGAQTNYRLPRIEVDSDGKGLHKAAVNFHKQQRRDRKKLRHLHTIDADDDDATSTISRSTTTTTTTTTTATAAALAANAAAAGAVAPGRVVGHGTSGLKRSVTVGAEPAKPEEEETLDDLEDYLSGGLDADEPVEPSITDDELAGSDGEVGEQSDGATELSTNEKEEEFLLSTLVSSGFLSGTIRSVFSKGIERRFRRVLNKYIKERKHVTERLCAEHYDEFLKSIPELSGIQEHIQKLQDRIRGGAERLEHSGKALVQMGRQALRLSYQRRNILAALEAVQYMDHVATLYRRVEECIASKRLIPALHFLQTVSSTLLPLLPYTEGGDNGNGAAQQLQRIGFLEYIQKRLPSLHSQIEAAAGKQVNDWLVNVREHQQDIGQMSLSTMEQKISQENSRVDRVRGTLYHRDSGTGASTSATAAPGRQRRGNVRFGQQRSSMDGEEQGASPGGSDYTPMRLQTISQAVSSLETDLLDSESVFEKTDVTFAPLFQSVYVHRTLYGMLDVVGDGGGDEVDEGLQKFRRYYEDNRRIQLNLDLNRDLDLSERWIQNYVYSIAGFFLVEDRIQRSLAYSSNGVMGKHTLDGLWEYAISVLKTRSQEWVMGNETLDRVRVLKELLVLFTFIMQSHGHHVSSLFEYIESFVHQRFDSIMRRELRKELDRIHSADHFEGMEIAHIAQWKMEAIGFGLYPAAATPEEFPFRCSFSSSIVETIRCLSDVCINEYTAFYKLYRLQSGAEYEKVQRSIVDTLRTCVADRISEQLQQGAERLQISQVVQIAINCFYLAERVCPHLEEKVYTLSSSYARPARAGSVVSPQVISNASKASGVHRFLEPLRQKFGKLRKIAEDMVLTVVLGKVDSQLLIWKESDMDDEGAVFEDTITFLIAYLRTITVVLNTLLVHQRDSIYLTLCQHIANTLMQRLVSTRKTLTPSTLGQMRTAIAELKSFADELYENVRSDAQQSLEVRYDDAMDHGSAGKKHGSSDGSSPPLVRKYANSFVELLSILSFVMNDDGQRYMVLTAQYDLQRGEGTADVERFVSAVEAKTEYGVVFQQPEAMSKVMKIVDNCPALKKQLEEQANSRGSMDRQRDRARTTLFKS